MSGATVGAREITIRGVVLGALITLVFTAANVYLGLRVGLTFATSIPAAVISMGVLRLFANHSVVENNIVQTIASAAGTLSSIIFVLPALLMIGWGAGFRTGQRRRCVHWAGSLASCTQFRCAAHSSPDQTCRTQKALPEPRFSRSVTPHGRWSTTVGELG
ncbi:putative integral membrane protein [Mycobacterium tuberculosis]|nr:putative integral membrane protein [Mycobacterium tuberculosis]